MGRFPCTNLRCIYDSHEVPTCPYYRPVRRVDPRSPGAITNARYLAQRRRAGAFDSGPSLPRVYLSRAGVGWLLLLGVGALLALYLLLVLL